MSVGLPIARPLTQPAFQLRLWGGVRLARLDGTSVTLSARRARGLIALVARGGESDRSRLAEMLWSDHDDARARANLRQLLLEFRSDGRGEPAVLVIDRESVAFDRDVCAVDADRLDDLVSSGDVARLSSALEETDPRFLHDLEGIGESFDVWLRTERERTQSRLAAAVRRLTGPALGSGDPAGASALASAWARFDPCDEAVARHGMAADGRGGDAAGVQRRLTALRTALRRDLDVAPAAATVAAAEEALAAAKGPVTGAPSPASYVEPLPLVAAPPSAKARRLHAGIAALLALAVGGAGWAYFTAHPIGETTDTPGQRAEATRLTRAAAQLIDGRTRAGYASAEALLRRAVSRAPHYAPAWVELGLAVRMPAIWAGAADPAAPERLKAEAVEYVDRGLALDPQSARGFAVRGMVVGPPEGIPWLERAVARDPNDTDAWLWLGEGLSHEQRFGAALKAIGRAVSLAPAAKRTVDAYATLSLDMGHGDEAAAAIARFAAVSPNRYDADILRANLAIRSGDLIGGATYAAAALAGAPEDPYKALRPLLAVAHAIGDDAATNRILAASAGLRGIWAPVFDDTLAVQRAGQRASTLFSEPVAEDLVRALVRHGRNDVVIGAVTASGGSAAAAVRRCECAKIALGASLVAALRNAGHMGEADRLLAVLADDAASRREHGMSAASTDLDDALVAALQGRRAAALTAYGHAIDKGWRGQFRQYARDPADEPAFAGLRGDPGFQRLRMRLAALVDHDRNRIEPILARAIPTA